jgi:hypothetical protein
MNKVKPLTRKAINSIRSTDYLTVWEGAVRSGKANPLEITLKNTMLPLSRRVLILTETVTTPPLIVGDKVIMLRVLGGQNFIVLSRTQ